MGEEKIVETEFSSLGQLIDRVLADYASWGTEAFPWFRGERIDKNILTPKLYQKKSNNENRFLQRFREKAPTLGLASVPPLERIDQWLFLAQHVGLPTRLLDWTEGLLAAVYFALKTPTGLEMLDLEDIDQDCKDKLLPKKPVVWMLNPHELNKLEYPEAKANVFGLTWIHNPEIPARKEDILVLLDIENREKNLTEYKSYYRKINIGSINIKAAWSAGRVKGTHYPVAILPTYVHPRMSSQKSCFTIWGCWKDSLIKMPQIGSNVIKKYVLDVKNEETFLSDLRLMGVTATTLFTDLDNLARELRETPPEKAKKN